MRRIFKQICRFSTEGIKQKQQSNLTTAQQRFSQTPIHLRPYDKSKYEVPMAKIKKNSGYALLQIEPFPRARIMKICYNILQQLKNQIPEDCIQRIYLEEKTKYIMEITDKTEDVQEIEDIFGTDSVELLILGLARTLEWVAILRQQRFWQTLKPYPHGFELDSIKPYQSEKFPIYKKGERPQSKLLDV